MIVYDPMYCSQAPLSMGFSRQEYWSGLPCPSAGDLPNPGIKPMSPTLQENSLTAEPPGKPKKTGVGSLSLLQGIFPTQRSNGGLLHCWRILYQLRKERKHYLKEKGIHYFKCASRGTTQASWRSTVTLYHKKNIKILQKPNLKSQNIIIWQRIQNNYHEETQKVTRKLRQFIEFRNKINELINRKNNLPGIFKL